MAMQLRRKRPAIDSDDEDATGITPSPQKKSMRRADMQGTPSEKKEPATSTTKELRRRQRWVESGPLRERIGKKKRADDMKIYRLRRHEDYMRASKGEQERMVKDWKAELETSRERLE